MPKNKNLVMIGRQKKGNRLRKKDREEQKIVLFVFLKLGG